MRLRSRDDGHDMGRYDAGRDVDGGAIAILVAILSVVLFGLAAVVVDLGMVRIVVAQQQSAADAAALAGAASLYADDVADPPPNFLAAAAAVKTSGVENGIAIGSWVGCMAPVRAGWVTAGTGTTTCITFDSATRPRRVQVVVPSQRVAAAFGGVFGYSGSDVSRLAQAQARDRKIQDCSLCLSGRLEVGKDGKVSVKGDGSLVAKQGLAEPTSRVAVTGEGALAFEEFPPTPGPGDAVWSPEPEQSNRQNPFPIVSLPDLSQPLVPEPMRCPADTGPNIDLTMSYRSLDIEADCRVENGTLVVTGSLRILDGARLTGNGATIYLTCRVEDLLDDCTPSASGRGRLFVLAGGSLQFEGGDLDGDNFGSMRRLGVACAPGNSRGSTISGEGGLSNSSIDCSQSTWFVDGNLKVEEGLASLGRLAVAFSGRVDLAATGLGSGPGPFRLALVK